jgi:hypothetical protein
MNTPDGQGFNEQEFESEALFYLKIGNSTDEFTSAFP